MRKLIILSFIIISMSLQLGCKSKKVNKISEEAPDNPNRSVGNPDPRTADTQCNAISVGSYIQGETIDTIYYYTLDNEMISIKPFPNWYSYYRYNKDLEASSITVPPYQVVTDQCIVGILDDVIAGRAIELDAFPNRARIRVYSDHDDSGTTYINGVAVSLSASRTLDTGLYEQPFVPGKNIVAISIHNSSSFAGAAARIDVNDCGDTSSGQCDGTGYSFYSEEPFNIDYTLPPEVSSCFPLYAVNFYGASTWGLTLDLPPSGWTDDTDMDGFDHIPEGYSAGSNGSRSISGNLSGAQWMSAGVNHPWCGAEGYDWGRYSGESGNLYFKTIITCNYYFCWQADEDLVYKSLYVP